MTQRPRRRANEQPIVNIKGKEAEAKARGAASKAQGTLAEVTVPFDRYSGPEWNHIAGGAESSSSRTNIARQSSHDKRAGREGTAGIDFIVENVNTGQLVIGEQKATQGGAFKKTTAITTSLEKNLETAAATLQEKIDSGAVKKSEVSRLENTIKRLKATQQALEAGRGGKTVELPPGVVFELTNVGGEGAHIGPEHIRLLEKQ